MIIAPHYNIQQIKSLPDGILSMLIVINIFETCYIFMTLYRQV